MPSFAEAAIAKNASAADVAVAAAKDAAGEAKSDADREDLGLSLYKEATGRFPQHSRDRMTCTSAATLSLG